MHCISTKQGYKLEGYPLNKETLATLQASGDVKFQTLTSGQLWENCSCGKEPVCVNCFKCGAHCKCGASFWTITPAGISKVLGFGLEVIVDDIKLQNTENIEMSLGNAKAKADEAMKQKAEKARVAKEELEASRKAQKEKVESWEKGKITLKIPDFQVAFDVIESIIVDEYATRSLIRFVSPKVLEGLEGVKCEFRGYDTDYNSFLAPAEIANILNTPFNRAEWKEKAEQLLGEPNPLDVENALAGLGHEGFKMQVEGDSGEKEFFSNPTNCQAVINRWIEIETEIAKNGERHTSSMRLSRSTTGTYFTRSWDGKEGRNELIADALGITAKLEATWESSKPVIESRRQEAINQKEEERKAAEAKYQAEQAARQAERQANITRIAATIKGTKQDLLARYPGAGLKKSWSKDQMIGEIAKTITDGRDVEKKALPSKKEEDFEEGPDVY